MEKKITEQMREKRIEARQNVKLALESMEEAFAGGIDDRYIINRLKTCYGELSVLIDLEKDVQNV